MPKTVDLQAEIQAKYQHTPDGGSIFVTYFCPRCMAKAFNPVPTPGREEYRGCDHCGAIICLRGLSGMRARVSAWVQGGKG